MNTCFLFFSYLFWVLWLSLVVCFNFGVVVKDPKFQNVRNINFSRPGARFSKVPKTFRARKAIRKTMTRSFCKTDLFICCKGNKN